MTKPHKVMVLIPPLLIGVSILFVFFTMQHQSLVKQGENNQPAFELSTSTDYEVVTELPPILPPQTASGTPQNIQACSKDARICPDGTTVGRTGPDCSFSQCPDASPKKEVFTCGPSSREVDACIELYAPVCASYQVQCVTTPCPPVPKTYGNSCHACMDNNVISFTEGECVYSGAL